MRTTLIAAFAAALLAGCTISTELDPRGFQYWRNKDRITTGSNLPRREGDDAGLKSMEVQDVEKMQRGTPMPRTN